MAVHTRRRLAVANVGHPETIQSDGFRRVTESAVGHLPYGLLTSGGGPRGALDKSESRMQLRCRDASDTKHSDHADDIMYIGLMIVRAEYQEVSPRFLRRDGPSPAFAEFPLSYILYYYHSSQSHRRSPTGYSG